MHLSMQSHSMMRGIWAFSHRTFMVFGRLRWVEPLKIGPVITTRPASTPFHFPRVASRFKGRIRALAEELDALRKRALSENDFLTMTKLYNVREKLKSGAPLDDSEKAIYEAGSVGVIHELHNEID